VSDPAKTSNEVKILGAFAGSVGLFSIALYFTGWIYRWAYFGFFRLEINALNFPVQSFFFVPIQVFLGSRDRFLQALLTLIVAVILIRVTLWLLLPPDQTPKPTPAATYQGTTPYQVPQVIQRLGRSQFASRLKTVGRSLVRLVHKRLLPINWLIERFRYIAQIFPSSFLKDLIIVAWILTILFWLARWQGEADARQAANNGTSWLPVITLVHTEKGLGIGQGISDDPTKLPLDSPVDKARIIGDAGLFKKLRGREATYPGVPNSPMPWRLLINSNGWIYFFQSLPPKSDPKRRPMVIAVREGGGEQIIILSPTVSEEKSP
jgi:hypothetical protein